VTYTYSFEYDHDWGDSCRSHRTTYDDYFSFEISPELLAVYVEVYPEPFSFEAQNAMLDERPCRSEYPVRVTVILSAPDAGGAGTHSWYDRSTDICPACDSCPVPGSLEDTGSEQVGENNAAGYRAYLYGTYRMDPAGRDTIVARYQGVTTVNSAQSGGGDCAGVNDACNCQAEDDVADDFTLTLTRYPESDRDMDMLCDSVDPCPDAAYSEDCAQ
jgi:hypothetical protein